LESFSDHIPAAGNLNVSTHRKENKMKVYDVVPGLEFDPERDFEQSPAWFLDGSLPTVKGWDWRFMNGGGYLTLLLVKSEEEKQRREERFRKAILPFIQDYDGLWNGFVDEILGRYESLKSLNLDEATNIELLDNFEETINTCRRMWEIHMYMMYGTYTLWECSKRAQEDGLADVFLQNEPANIAAALASTEKGKAFLKDFMDFMNEDGWRMQRMSEINLPTWVEDPTPALGNVKQFLAKGGGFNLDEKRQKNAEEREAAEKEVLAKVPQEQRGWFEQLLRLAQKCGVFSEEHDHYLDLYTHAMMRRSALGLGKRWVQKGTIDDHEDMFFLIPDEIRRAGINPDQFDLRYIVERRKAEWEEWKKTPNPPAMLKEGFDLDQAMGVLVQSNDPIALKVVVGAMPAPNSKPIFMDPAGPPG
jgi:hypothetical protein